MDHNRHLQALASCDPRLGSLPLIRLGGTAMDHSHAARRAQQRGISATKLRIALAYGIHEHHLGLERWTLYGRRLRRTPYARYLRELEGLQLVGTTLTDGLLAGRALAVSPEAANGIVLLRTCKWNWALRRR